MEKTCCRKIRSRGQQATRPLSGEHWYCVIAKSLQGGSESSGFLPGMDTRRAVFLIERGRESLRWRRIIE